MGSGGGGACSGEGVFSWGGVQGRSVEGGGGLGSGAEEVGSGGLGSGGGWVGSGGGRRWVQVVGVMDVQVGVLRWGGCSGGGVQVGRVRFSGGRGANGQTLWGLKGSKRANVGEGGNLRECFCNLSLSFEMDKAVHLLCKVFA